MQFVIGHSSLFIIIICIWKALYKGRKANNSIEKPMKITFYQTRADIDVLLSEPPKSQTNASINIYELLGAGKMKQASQLCIQINLELRKYC